jgi:hypothetical protein
MGISREDAAADAKSDFPSTPQDTGSRSLVTILLEDYGITTSVSNEGVTFAGDMFDILKENISAKQFENITSPADLLKAFGYKVTAAAPRVSIATEESAESMKSEKDPNKPDLKSILDMVRSSEVYGSSATTEEFVDAEQIKRNIAMLAGKQNPLNDECAGQ